jgi:hypothetical protein
LERDPEKRMPVFPEIMLQKENEIMMRNRIMIADRMTTRPIVSQVRA